VEQLEAKKKLNGAEKKQLPQAVEFLRNTVTPQYTERLNRLDRQIEKLQGAPDCAPFLQVTCCADKLEQAKKAAADASKATHAAG